MRIVGRGEGGTQEWRIEAAIATYDQVGIYQFLDQTDDLVKGVMHTHRKIHRSVRDLGRLAGGDQRAGGVFDVNEILPVLPKGAAIFDLRRPVFDRR